MDDASTDDTVAVAEEFRSAAVPLRTVYLASPVGSIAARNRVLELASTEWIAVLDADDVWLPEKLARQFAFLDSWTGRRPIVVLGTKGRHIGERDNDLGAYDPPGAVSEEEFDAAAAGGGFVIVGHSSALYRQEDARAAGGYDEQALGCEDIDLWERISLLRDGVVLNVPEELFLYRKKRGGMMHSNTRTQQMNFERLAENRLRRRKGLAPLTFPEFAFELQSRPALERMGWEVRARGAWLYRFGAMNLGNGSRAKGTVQLAAAAVLRPRLVVSGVRRALR